MKEHKQLIKRCRALNQKPVNRDGRWVICWIRVNLRGVNNPVIDAAVAMANSLEVAPIVIQCIEDEQPHGSDRLHTFQIQASISLEKALAARGIPFIRSICTSALSPDSALQALLENASAIVVDEVTVGSGLRLMLRAAESCSSMAIAVDGQRLVPELAFGKTFNTTPAFRSAFHARREHWIEEQFDLTPVYDRCDTGQFSALHTPVSSQSTAIATLIASRQIDHTLPPAAWCHGSREQALRVLAWAACEVIPNYARDRNNPSLHGVTYLSPYLHYGILCPHDIGRQVMDMKSSRGTWKFLDECFVWREFYHHLAYNSPDVTRYQTIPMWARKTLAEHSADPRKALYSLDELIHGETGDETWNAAQRQFLVDGYMHNNLRMYWGKQILRWTKDPEAAWYTACYLNDRLSLDGQDPSTYGSISWCFGGGRPSTEVEVYGRVSRKSDAALRRRVGVAAWLEKSAHRTIPRVRAPETLPE